MDELTFVYVVHILELLYDIQYKVPNFNIQKLWDVDGFLLGGILIMYGATPLVPIHIVFLCSFWILQIVGNVKTIVHCGHHSDTPCHLWLS